MTSSLTPNVAITSHIISETLTLHDENPHYTGPGNLLYQPDSVVYQYDPSGHGQLSKTLTTVGSSGVDKDGNIKQRTTKVTDAYGEYTTVQLGEFDLDNDNTRSLRI